MTTFQHIANNATQPSRSWSNVQVLQFHYFNPNGLYWTKIATDARIDKLVEQDKARPGAILAYGSLNNFHMYEIVRLNRLPSIKTIELNVVLEGLREDIAKAERFIAERECQA
jgi:hypothetical protein